MRSMTLFLAVLVISTSLAMAGQEGGGGAVVVCKNTNNEIASVRLLDLYQAELEWEMEIPRSNEDQEVQRNRGFQRMGKNEAFELNEALSLLTVKFLPSNLTLNQPYDLGNDPVLIEDNCKIEWVAFYADGSEETLKVVTKYYNLMSPTDRAALFAHEAIYKFARKNRKDKDSQKSRFLVGLLFDKRLQRKEITSSLYGLFNWRNTVTVKNMSEIKIEARATNGTVRIGCYNAKMILINEFTTSGPDEFGSVSTGAMTMACRYVLMDIRINYRFSDFTITIDGIVFNRKDEYDFENNLIKVLPLL